ncbi:hypothetical protein B0H19DRAFT_858461, partial [Mycena capillaripes]
RLYKRRGRFWADDVCALVAFVTLIIQVVAVFLHVMVPSRFSVPYLTGTTFYLIVWASRLSILFSIVRIDPSPQRRKRMVWASIAFAAATVFLLSQLFWVCESDTSWKNSPNPTCELPLQVAICRLVTDVIADLILLFAPLPLFRKLDKSLGHKFMLIFSTCVVTTFVSVVHVAFIVRYADMKIPISEVVQGCISLIVANIPVVITTTIDIVGEPDHARTS